MVIRRSANLEKQINLKQGKNTGGKAVPKISLGETSQAGMNNNATIAANEPDNGRSMSRTRSRSQPETQCEPQEETAYDCIYRKAMANLEEKKARKQIADRSGEDIEQLPVPNEDDVDRDLLVPKDHDGVLVQVHAPEHGFSDSEDDVDDSQDRDESPPQHNPPTEDIEHEGIMQINLTTTLSEEEKQHIRSDPGFQQLLKQLVELDDSTPAQLPGEIINQPANIQSTPALVGNQIRQPTERPVISGAILRSPSESTLYVPALAKATDNQPGDGMVID